jgi:hypothetical protein
MNVFEMTRHNITMCSTVIRVLDNHDWCYNFNTLAKDQSIWVALLQLFLDSIVPFVGFVSLQSNTRKCPQKGIPAAPFACRFTSVSTLCPYCIMQTPIKLSVLATLYSPLTPDAIATTSLVFAHTTTAGYASLANLTTHCFSSSEREW